MKTKSAPLLSTGVLALLVFIALPSPIARASQGQCPDVDIHWEYGGGNQICVVLEVGNGCDISVTTSLDNPSFPDPSRSGATPIPPTIKVSSGATICIPYGHTLCVKAFGYKPLWTQSVNLTSECFHNPDP